MPYRVTIRAALYEVMEDLVMHAHETRDRTTLRLSEEAMQLFERQYLGLERIANELDYGEMTAATKRLERAVEMGMLMSEASTSTAAD